jgi:hypothetical protein
MGAHPSACLAHVKLLLRALVMIALTRDADFPPHLPIRPPQVAPANLTAWLYYGTDAPSKGQPLP